MIFSDEKSIKHLINLVLCTDYFLGGGDNEMTMNMMILGKMVTLIMVMLIMVTLIMVMLI